MHAQDSFWTIFIVAGVALSFLCLTGFVVARVVKTAPNRLPAVLLAMATLLAALPPVLKALWTR